MLSALVLLCGCGGKTAERTSGGDTLTFSYASLLRVERAEGYVIADVRDAWRPGRTLRRYLLVPKGNPLPSGLPEGTVVRTPLSRAVAFSSVHACLLADLGKMSALCGVCDAEYLLRADLRRALDAGELTNMGQSAQPDVERLLAARADALLVSPFENAGYGQIAQTNIPLIECADYMEVSPLGRAEWLRFYGLLFGCEQRADSLFEEVERAYVSLRELAQQKSCQPRLLCDIKQGGVWYVPGGGSTMGQLFCDGGADYLFAADESSGSVGLSFEKVYATAAEADLWFVKYGSNADMTYASLAEDFPPYARFAPWKNRRIYGCNTFAVPFYEETPFRPDRLLRDIVRICHPELLPEHTLRYYQPLR